jgi:Cache 3/Cache 2 fusion domain
MIYWIYDYPSWVTGIVFVGGLVAFTWIGIFVTRATVHAWLHRDKRANEMVGLALTSYFVLFGLLLGLLAVATYQNYATVGGLVDQEASSMSSLWKQFGAYPQPIRGQLQHALREYARYTIQEGWEQQRKGNLPEGEPQRSGLISKILLSFEPTKESEKIIHAATLPESIHRIQLSRARISNVGLGLPTVLWRVVAFCALLNIILIWMQDMEIHVHLILGGVLAAVLAAVIFLIAELDNPFRGEVAIGPESIARVYETVMNPNVMKQLDVNPMADLIAKAGKLGAPKLEGKDSVAGKDVPGLYFGSTKMNNFFDVVDQVVKEDGGTATIFVKSGDEYVRVATNVKKDDGSRAIGTILDPKGPVIEMIRKGEAFYGEAIVLDKPYMTGYEPIKDASGNVIGIYYVGYIK